MLMSREEAAALDAVDPLRAHRDQFELPEGVIYLDGNSLGPLSHAARDAAQTCIGDEWGRGLIRSWNTAGWVDLPKRCGRRLAGLLGAAEQDVRVADSTSINLYKLLVAALALRSGRRTVLTEAGNFPTDLYITDAATRAGATHGVRRVAFDEIEQAIDETVAVVVLSHVHYRTGARHDMAAVTRRAHACGALVLWDLAHSAGAVPLNLAGDDVDLAIGCGYKFLNGGPGAPAFLYVAPGLQPVLENPICGWFGHARPFEFDDVYEPAAGMDRWQVGTPGVIGMRSLEGALSVWDSLSISDVAEKSAALFDGLAAWIDGPLADAGFELVTPRDPARRGSQVSCRHPDAWPICQALIEAGVIGDFRTPDILRFGLTPLYLRHVDVWDAGARLAQIMASGRWRDARFQVQQRVT